MSAAAQYLAPSVDELPAARPIRDIYQNYVDTFATLDPAKIVENHAPDGTFWLHTGGKSIQGRDAIAQTFAAFFKQWPQFGFEVHRVLFTEDNWILDWSVTAVLPNKAGEPTPIRFDAVDLIDVNADGLVSRKDTFIDGGQLQAALATLG